MSYRSGPLNTHRSFITSLAFVLALVVLIRGYGSIFYYNTVTPDPGDRTSGSSPETFRAPPAVLITALFPNPVRPETGDTLPDEFITISNCGSGPVDVGGWLLTDGEGTIAFPVGASLPSGAEIRVTGNGSAFRKDLGFGADYEWHSTDPATPDLPTSDKFWLANSGEAVSLYSDMGEEIDTVVYGGDSAAEGWSGDNVPAPSEGEVMRRNLRESSAEFEDTDAKEDWLHYRKYWLGHSAFLPKSFSVNGVILPFVSPDSAFPVLSREIDSATSRINITLYQFTNWHLARRLLDALDRGVKVNLLLEGGPVGWHMDNWGEQDPRVNQQKYIVSKLVEHGGQVRFMITDGEKYVKNRYSYLHAKYAVFDDERSAVMTENWKESGVPTDPSAGNRGWGIMIEDRELAGYLNAVFSDDWDDTHPDIFHFSPAHERYGDPVPGFTVNGSTPAGDYRPHFSAPELRGEFNVTPIISPDTSLISDFGVLKLLKEAEETVLAQLFYFDKEWRRNGLEGLNPYLEGLLDAAERGCKVKVMLDSTDYDEDGTPDNKWALDYLNDLARDEGLDLKAALLDPEMTNLNKTHNKGVIVDSSKVLVSSINWNLNSITNNREIALVIESEEAADFFTDVIESDWENRDPVAVASEDVLMRPGESADFNGSASHDPDGDPLTYEWTFPGPSRVFRSVTERRFDRAGTYQVKLTVEDGRGGIDVDTVNVTVNTAPVAVICASVKRTVPAGEPLGLDGSCSYDGDGQSLNYTWGTGDGGNASGERVEHVFGEAGERVIWLRVSDGIEQSFDSLTVNVTLPENSPPRVVVSSPGEGDEYNDTDRIVFNATESFDPDGDDLSFEWRSNRSGALGSDPFFERSMPAGDHTITLSVEDEAGHVVEAVRNLSVVKADENATEEGKGTTGDDGGEEDPDDGRETAGEVTILEPENGSILQGMVTVRVNVKVETKTEANAGEPPGVDNRSVEVFVRFGKGDWWSMGESGGLWTYEWNTSSYPNGTYIVTCGMKIGRNWADTDQVEVELDNPGRPPDADHSRGTNEESGTVWAWVLILLAAVLLLVTGVLSHRLYVTWKKRTGSKGTSRDRGSGEKNGEDLRR